MAKDIVLSWELSTRAPIEQTWRELSDTDRFNRVAEAGFSFARDARGPIQGSLRKLGMTVRWVEEPFTYRAPRWFRVERRFDGSPGEHLIARADLQPLASGGTAISYRIEVRPRNFIASTILAIDLDRTTRPKIDRALRSLVEALDKNAVFETYGRMTPALSADAERFLARTSRQLTPSPLRDRLLSFLRVGPEREQARMSPPALADAWREQLDDVINLLVHATEAGLLSVTLELLCPACQVPRQAFAEHVSEVHCEACGIRYDATFPESLAVHFRPARELRDIRMRVECIGSPGLSPHIVAQDNIAPGGEVDLVADLRAGMHRIRTLPAFGPPALVEIVDGGGAREARFRCTTMVHPQMVRLSSPKQILFSNETQVPVTVVLERMQRPPQLVTAGRLLAEFPRFRALAPVSPFFSNVTLYRGAVLALTAGEPVEGIVAKLTRAKLTYASSPCVFAVYSTLGALLDDAAPLGLLDGSDTLQTFGGASLGMVFDHTRDGRIIPMGSAVDEAYAAMQGAGFGRLTLPERVASQHESVRDLAFREVSADPHGYPGSDGQSLVELRK